MNHINEIRDFKMFKLNINNKKVVCYWDLQRNEYQFFRSPSPLDKTELKEMKKLIHIELEKIGYNAPMSSKDFKFGLQVFDTITREIWYLFELGRDSKGIPGVYIDRGKPTDEKIEFRYFDQVKLLSDEQRG